MGNCTTSPYSRHTESRYASGLRRMALKAFSICGPTGPGAVAGVRTKRRPSQDAPVLMAPSSRGSLARGQVASHMGLRVLDRVGQGGEHVVLRAERIDRTDGLEDVQGPLA